MNHTGRFLILAIASACLIVSTVAAPSHALDWPNFWVPDFDNNGIDSPLACAVQNKLAWGYIDSTGNFVIPPIYDSAEPVSNGSAAVTQNGNSLLLHPTGKSVKRNLSPVKEHDDDFKITQFKKDVLDQTGKRLIAAGANELTVYPFSEGLAAFRMPLHLVEKYYPDCLPKEYSSIKDPLKKAEYLKNIDDFGQCGYINENGYIAISPQFQHAYPFNEGLAKYKGRQEFWQQGFIDKAGCLLGGRDFQNVEPFRNGFAYVSFGTTHGFIDKTGRVIIDQLEEGQGFSDDHAAIKKDGKWSLIDQRGLVVASLDVDDVCMCGPGPAIVTKNHLSGFINNSTGKVIVPLKFAEAKDFSEGLAAVAIDLPEKDKLSQLSTKIDLQCGYININGDLVIGPSFMGARFFSEGLAPVRDGLKWGYIDTSGSFKIQPQFDDARSFSDGLAGVRVGYLWGYIDKTGSFAIKPKFGVPSRQERTRDSVGRFSEGVAVVKQADYAWKFIDKEGKICLNQRAVGFPTEENNFHEGLALVQPQAGQDGTGSAYVDKRDRLVSKGYAVTSRAFSEGLAEVGYTKDNNSQPKTGFIDKEGTFVIAPTFSRGRSFKQGMAAVAHGDWPDHWSTFEGKWGFIDKSGRVIIEEKYDDAHDFSEGLAAVKLGSKWGFINKSGEMVVSPQYDDVGTFSDGRAFVKNADRYGFINPASKVVIPIRYWLAGPFCEGLALVVFPTNKQNNVTTSSSLSFPIKTQKDFNEFLKGPQKP